MDSPHPNKQNSNQNNEHDLSYILTHILKENTATSISTFLSSFTGYNDKINTLSYLMTHIPKKTHQHLLNEVKVQHDKLMHLNTLSQELTTRLMDETSENDKKAPLFIKSDAYIHKSLKEFTLLKNKIILLELTINKCKVNSFQTTTIQTLEGHLMAIRLTESLLSISAFHQHLFADEIRHLLEIDHHIPIDRKIWILNKTIFYLTGESSSSIVQFALSTIESYKHALSDSLSSESKTNKSHGTFSEKMRDAYKEVLSQLGVPVLKTSERFNSKDEP